MNKKQKRTAATMLKGTKLPSRDCFNSILVLCKPSLSLKESRVFTPEGKKYILAASHIANAVAQVSPAGREYVNSYMLPLCEPRKLFNIDPFKHGKACPRCGHWASTRYGKCCYNFATCQECTCNHYWATYLNCNSSFEATFLNTNSNHHHLNFFICYYCLYDYTT